MEIVWPRQRTLSDSRTWPSSRLQSTGPGQPAPCPAPTGPNQTSSTGSPAYEYADLRNQPGSLTCDSTPNIGITRRSAWTLYFETDQGDGFREPGFSKERRLEPLITIGLLTD